LQQYPRSRRVTGSPRWQIARHRNCYSRSYRVQLIVGHRDIGTSGATRHDEQHRCVVHPLHRQVCTVPVLPRRAGHLHDMAL